MPVRFGLLVAIVALLVPALSFAQPAVPDVPLEIAVPAGHKLLFKLQAKGVQIYKAVERKAGVPEWVLEAPLAELFDGNGNAGHHYDNPPAWEAADGSKVVKSDAKSAPAPKPKEDIPWLLVKLQAEKGAVGRFSPVVYIQRLNTEGGKAPPEIPHRVGTKVGMPYKATYYFYGQVE